MDTSTHITMGFGLAGLALLDPSIDSNPQLANAIMLCTVVGSNAPDFDYFIKLFKGNGMYVEHHRGASHSIPALFIWSLLISGMTFSFFNDASFFQLFVWTLIAVVVHVVFDIFNAYGTQAGRPFTKKWLSINIIPLFDPFIMFIHFIGFTFWIIGFHPGFVFIYAYFIIIGYIILRFLIANRKKQLIGTKESLPPNRITLIPSIWLNKWDIVIEKEKSYDVGRIEGKAIIWYHHFDKYNNDSNIINKSLMDKNVNHFLANSKHTHVLTHPISSGIEVRWIDLRFRNKNHYPYMAVVKFDKESNIQASFTGWVHNTSHLSEKLAKHERSIVADG